MLYDFLRFGGVTIANNARTYDYLQQMGCPEWLLYDKACPTLRTLPGEPDDTSIANAPWYDLANPDVSGRFGGVYVTSARGDLDTNRSTQVTEGIDDGAAIGRTRRTARTLRVQAMLLARGEDALEYGQAWLSAVLDGSRCSQHGASCGSTDLEYLVSCPTERDEDDTETEHAARVDSLRRFMHEVTCTSGPLERAVSHRGEWWRLDVEFTLTAGRAWVYSATRPVDLPVTPTIVIQDAPYNLVPYPSAELSDGDPLVIATNYSTNPSVETNATGWSTAADASAILAANLTAGRSTGELVAVGFASYRVVFTAPSAGVEGWFAAQQLVNLPESVVAGQRYSISMWAAELVMVGTPARGDLEIVAVWRSGSTALRTDSLGVVSVDGGAVSVRSIDPPVGADNVAVRAVAHLDSWASGNVIRLYADALAVTTP